MLNEFVPGGINILSSLASSRSNRGYLRYLDVSGAIGTQPDVSMVRGIGVKQAFGGHVLGTNWIRGLYVT